MWISGEAQLNNPQDLTGSTAFLDCATHGRCASATLTATQRKLTGFDSQPSRQVSWCEHSFNAQVEFIRWITAKLQVFWDFLFFSKNLVFFFLSNFKMHPGVLEMERSWVLEEKTSTCSGCAGV